VSGRIGALSPIGCFAGSTEPYTSAELIRSTRRGRGFASASTAISRNVPVALTSHVCTGFANDSPTDAWPAR
jgi:hypothetical protein